MNIIEELIIITGISLDIFAIMECKGSMMARIEKKHLTWLCGVLVIGQALALGIGDFISVLLSRYKVTAYDSLLGQVLASAIFFCMGVRLLLKAWKNERIQERREESFDRKKFIRLYGRISVLALLTGIAFGFLESSMAALLAMIVVMTAAVTVLGIYTGYRLGFEHKVKAYFGGGILLSIAGVDVIIRYIMNII